MENPGVAYCEELIELANTRDDIVLITADSADIIGLGKFAEVHPDKFFDVGIAEQAMTNIGAGFASVGFTPFISAFAMFQTLRGADSIRNGIAYPFLNVKIVSANISLNVGKNGTTHHALEDLALMRAIPDLIVVSPADAKATKKLVRAIAEIEGPAYLRIDKVPIPVVYSVDEEFELGKGKILVEGADVTIFATGSTVHTALQAAEELQARNISPTVIDIHTIKPLDQNLILSAAEKTGAVVTVEPHSIIGGLGGAVSELLGNYLPAPIERVGVLDKFTESGTADELNEKYGLTANSIVHAAERVLKRKSDRLTGFGISI